jgi:hypothetical protein
MTSAKSRDKCEEAAFVESKRIISQLVRNAVPLSTCPRDKWTSTRADKHGQVEGQVPTTRNINDLPFVCPKQECRDKLKDKFLEKVRDKCPGQVQKRLYNPIKVTMFLPPDCSDLGEVDWS